MPQKPPKRDYFFVPEICQNGHFGDLGLSWGLDGGPDSQNHQNDLKNYLTSTYFLSKFRQSAHSCSYYKIQNKKWAAFRLVFLCFLEHFLQAEYQRIDLLIYSFIHLWIY